MCLTPQVPLIGLGAWREELEMSLCEPGSYICKSTLHPKVSLLKGLLGLRRWHHLEVIQKKTSSSKIVQSREIYEGGKLKKSHNA